MSTAEIQQQIDSFISTHLDAMVEDIATVVAVESLEGEAQPGAPFGPGPRKALDATLAIAKRLGLATQDGGGYVGWAEVPGKERGVIATITHVDIVPPGSGWTGDPYTLRQRDGWLIGRGVQDDKGPGILCLYAAKFLADCGIPLRYTLRVLLGCNEESGMGDVHHYLEQEGEPLFCFSPDANFPVCNGEKGVFEGDFVSGPLEGGRLLRFEGGVASNVIPSEAQCLVAADAGALPAADGITISPAEGGALLVAAGIGGHAAHPDGTRNAIGMLVDYLLANGLHSEAEGEFLRLLAGLHKASDGSGLGIACADDYFDPLTCIGGTIALREGRLSQNINIRYPTCTSGEKLTAGLGALAARHGAAFNTAFDAAPFYIPADNPAIDALLSTWNTVSGRSDAPFTMGGGTYARHFANAVSFGPLDRQEHRPAFAGAEHMADEAVSIAAMRTALKVYILALLKLQDVAFD